MYSFESSGSRRPLHLMVAGAFAGAVILFSLSNLEGMPAPFVFQLCAVVCLTVAVYLLSVYSLRMYRYAIEPNGIFDVDGMEQYDLVITEIMGKRMKVVSRVGLRDIDRPAVTVICRDGRRADMEAAKAAKEALCRDRRVFRYENTPVSAQSCYIPLIEEKAVVVIPVDMRMVEILKGK